jgi:glycosyltransferase involved in cell wall biosynthesis
MVRVLFAHNIRMKEDAEGNLYTHGSYSNSVWERYKIISDNLSVMARQEHIIYDFIDASGQFEKFDCSNMNVVYVEDIHRSIFAFINPLNRFKNNRIIKEAVNTHDFAIARLPSYQGQKVIKYAKKSKKPYICEIVGCPWDSLWNHSIKGKILAPFSFIQLKKTALKAPFVIYVTNEFLQQRYPTHGKSVSCSDVALTEFDEGILERRLEKIERLKTTDKLIVGTTAAVNVRFKGQQYIIKALGKLKKEGNINFEYQLVGGGDQTYLKRVAEKCDVKNQVKFLGTLPHDEVFKWLETIDIYAQPSRQEGLPRALIEAMSRGLPAFGARTGGIPELLEPALIFSNTRNNLKEICNILKKFDKITMLEQAKKNYKESKKYDKKAIEERRKSFFEMFTSMMQQVASK